MAPGGAWKDAQEKCGGVNAVQSPKIMSVLPIEIGSFRLDLTGLFDFQNRMKGIPQVLNSFIVLVWI